MQIDDKYKIVKDENNVILQFFEKRSRTKKDGEVEEYLFVDNYYYPNIRGALRKYVELQEKGAKDLIELFEKQDYIQKQIDKFVINH